MSDRTPIKVTRQAITVLSEDGYEKSTGWMVFNPYGIPPKIKHKKSEEILWCPYCGGWELFKREADDTLYRCEGVCRFTTTRDFYVRTTNDLWQNSVKESVKLRNRYLR